MNFKMNPLNRKQIRTMLNELVMEDKINIDEYIFFKSNDRIYIINNYIRNIDLSGLNINQIGLLFAEIRNNKFHLSDAVKDLFLK